MRPAARLRGILVVLVALAAIACLFASQLAFADVKSWVDARSTDGEVESYDAGFHARAQVRLLIAAVALGLGAVTMIVLRAWIDRVLGRTLRDARAWRSDAMVGTAGLWRSMSRWEITAVVAALLLGAVLRGLALNAAVTYDEAFTCTYYAVRPIPVILNDYSYPNNHILHTLLVKASLVLFGWGEAQARLPAFGAGMLALLFGWVWLRSVLGRQVALLSLILFAACGPLIQYGALARGYSITWLCLMASLLMAQHFLRTGNGFTALLIALVNGLGMWAVPTMVYGSAMVYLWIGSSISRKDGSPVRSRRMLLLLSSATFILLTLLFYAPVILTYGPGVLFHHDAIASSSLSPDVAGAWWVIAVAALFAGIAFRAYRRFIMALILAVVPLVILQQVIGPARIWYFLLFLLLPALPLAIEAALDRLKRFVRASDGLRSAILGSATLLVFFVAVPQGPPAGIQRYPGASEAATVLAGELQPTDRVLVNFPCEAPLEFYFLTRDLGIGPLYRKPVAGGRLWFVTGSDQDHSFAALAVHAGLRPGSWSDPRPVAELDRMAIFAARYQ